MRGHVFLALSRPSDGRDADFHHWYDAHHLQDVVDLCPGFVSGHRYFADDPASAAPAWPSLAIYRLESDDLVALHRAVSASAARFTPSGGVFAPDHAAWVYSASAGNDAALRDWLAEGEGEAIALVFGNDDGDEGGAGSIDRSPTLERAAGQRAGEHPTWRYLTLHRGGVPSETAARAAAVWTYASRGKRVETVARDA